MFDGHGGPQLAEYSKQKINSLIDSYLQDNVKTNKGISIGELFRNAL